MTVFKSLNPANPRHAKAQAAAADVLRQGGTYDDAVNAVVTVLLPIDPDAQEWLPPAFEAEIAEYKQRQQEMAKAATDALFERIMTERTK